MDSDGRGDPLLAVPSVRGRDEMPPRLAPDSTFQASWREGGLKRAAQRDFANGVIALVMASKEGGIVFDLAQVYPSVDREVLVAARDCSAVAIAFVESAVVEDNRAALGYDGAAVRAKFRERFPDLSEATFVDLLGYAAVRDR